MNDSVEKKWVGGICVRDNKILLIYRINNERLFNKEYFVFPGRLTEGESIEEALVKEFDLLSLGIEVSNLLFEKEGDEESECYYFCTYHIGELSTSNKIEGGDQTQLATPMWIPLNELEDLIVYPESVKQILLEQLHEEM
jgi:hypothetical protein